MRERNRKIKVLHQRGALLISLIVTMVVMAALGSGMLYYSSTSSYGELLANRQARAYYLGESGVNYALQQFNPNTNYTNGPFYNASHIPTLVTLRLPNGQLSTEQQFNVLTYDKPGDTTRLIIESTGIVGSGWLTTRQLVTKNIVKANPSLPGGAPPTAPVGFDTNTNTQLDTTWTVTPNTDVDIVSTGPSGGPAVQFKGFTGEIDLAWGSDMNNAWSSNGDLLSYAQQVKINIDRQGGKGQHYMLGLSFRLVDAHNSYGISFYRSNGTSGPDWWLSSAFTDFRTHSELNDGRNYVVLWKKIADTYTLLAYSPLSIATYGDVVTDATAQTLNDWSTLFIKVNERFDGLPIGSRRNRIKAYVIGPGGYPLGTSTWNFSSFKQITWTWVSAALNPSQSAPLTEVLDQSLTSAGFSSSRPEIGVHAFYDSNAANDQFFNGFGMAVQGTFTGSGGYQY